LQQGSTPTFNFAGNVTGFTGTLQLATGGGGNNATFELTNSTTIGGAAAVWNQQLQATGTTGFNTLEWAGTGSQTIPLGDLNTTGTSSGPGIRLLNATASTTATFQVGALNATSSYSGTIVNGTGTAEVTAITKVGTGAWTLTGANTYTGATSINGTGSLVLGATNTLTATSGITVGTGATLSLAAANALATPGATTSTTMGSPVSVAGQVPITLGGGTLLRNGTGVSLGSQSGTAGTVGIGLLTLTAASTINYGTTGVGTLNFNGLAGASSTNTLSIINYTTTEPPGTVGVDGTDDRLIFNQDVAGFLPDITIDGAATMEVALGNGEFSVITAVPEPSTWTAVLASVGLLGFCLRRKRHLAA
jgi:fibronectin-binding autotransporter adhesin